MNISNNMTPGFPIGNESYRSFANMELSCDFSLRQTKGKQTPNFYHKYIGEFRQSLFFPAWPTFWMCVGSISIAVSHFFWMKMCAMFVTTRNAFWVCARTMRITSRLPSLGITISRIILISSKKKMYWIYAESIIAVVQNAKIIGDSAKGKNPRNTMGQVHAIVDAHLAISHTFSPNLPRPTFVRASNFNLGPESRFLLVSEFRNGDSFNRHLLEPFFKWCSEWSKTCQSLTTRFILRQDWGFVNEIRGARCIL